MRVRGVNGERKWTPDNIQQRQSFFARLRLCQKLSCLPEFVYGEEKAKFNKENGQAERKRRDEMEGGESGGAATDDPPIAGHSTQDRLSTRIQSPSTIRRRYKRMGGVETSSLGMV